MPPALQTYHGSLSPQCLEQAVRTLRAIRERYEMGRNVDSAYVPAYSVQVALGYADMFWITAAIEALEKTIRDATGGSPGRALQTPLEDEGRT